jgi:hypothetical protein
VFYLHFSAPTGIHKLNEAKDLAIQRALQLTMSYSARRDVNVVIQSYSKNAISWIARGVADRLWKL